MKTSISANFTFEELACPHCMLLELHPHFLYHLQGLRTKIGYPFYVESCCRCEEHNLAVGGSSDSYHRTDLRGGTQAIDFRVDNGEIKADVLQYARNFGFYGIGVNKTAIHLDRRTFIFRSVWGY